ncbi:MAG: ABC transporter permease [Lachnospiraceae bacterium]|nr:ABC transporter permease [Lachnospiraceae bacterium]
MADTEHKVKEPLFHIAKRSSIVWWKAWLIRLGAILLALIVSGLVSFLLTKENPLRIYAVMIDGAFGTKRRLWSLGQNIAMLLCVSVAVAPAFKMKFWNIGAEGQVLAGGLASAACMILLGDSLPNPVLLLIMIVASIGAGALWGVIPAIFKARWNTNETLFTLMMNYIAIQLVSFFVYKFSVPKGSGQVGIINRTSHAGWLPVYFDMEYLLNIVVVLLITFVVYVYLNQTKHGYEISVVGESENTARYVGISVKKVIIRTMLVSGAICGMAGLLLVAGTDHTISRDTASGRGFTAIMVAWMAKFNPFFMILTSFLIVFLEKGETEISTEFGLNESFSEIITGIILFFIIGCEFFIQYSVKFRKKEVA